ncbi:MAG: RNA polymerase sporulation sigma factor SigH [Armatimonadota bacterium]
MYRELLDSIHNSFQGMVDEDIVFFAKQGNKRAVEFLLNKYKNIVEGKARSYFLAGADHEDVVQEGMIGLYKAIRDFRTDKLAGFRAFAEICITRQIITAVKTATRQKHTPLNRYVSLHRPVTDGDSEAVLIDVLPDACMVDPEKAMLDSDAHRNMNISINTELSSLECQVIHYYMDGLSYQEMAGLLSCRTKAVDNALQRAKRKIGEIMEKD